VLGQRLVRRLCDRCREPYEPPPELASTLDLRAASHGGSLTLYRPKGCPACNGLGFAGRTMILELLVMNDAIRSLVLRRAEAREIQTEAVRSGMQTMYMHGMRKALAGITTIEEVFRVTRDV
jgi:general secretion pathway protein E